MIGGGGMGGSAGGSGNRPDIGEERDVAVSLECITLFLGDDAMPAADVVEAGVGGFEGGDVMVVVNCVLLLNRLANEMFGRDTTVVDGFLFRSGSSSSRNSDGSFATFVAPCDMAEIRVTASSRSVFVGAVVAADVEEIPETRGFSVKTGTIFFR